MAGKGIPELLNYKQKGKDLNEFIKVPLSEKLAYCFGDPALTLMYTMTTTLLIYFYTNVVGMSAGAVGMIMLLSRVFDGFSDVLMGTIIDRTHSKYGKARIWILRLVVPYALAAVLLFTMPPMGNMGKIIYAFVTYNIMNTVVYTAISQPFHALGSLMSRDRRERDVICNIRMVLSITASMIITAVHTAADQYRSEYYRQSADGLDPGNCRLCDHFCRCTCEYLYCLYRACFCSKTGKRKIFLLWKHLKQPLPTGISLSLWG